MKTHRVLVIGCGSIGERHLRTFLATGRVKAIACDTRPAVREQMTGKYGVVALDDWMEALHETGADSVVIATPAPLHIEQATTALSSGRHVLIEKPLGVGLAGVDRLRVARDASGRIAAVAYIYHFLPALSAARDFILRGSIGEVWHAIATGGQHFPTYRPAYRETYYADHRQGGGAIQDALTHLANAVEWVVGPTTRVQCDAAHQVLDGVDVEDTVNALARNHRVLVNYALNQFQAPNEVRWDFHAERGSVRVDVIAQRWGTLARGESEWTWHAAPVAERDWLFIQQANAFLDACEGVSHSLCTLEEGIQTLRFNLAALQSWRESRVIEL